MALTISELDTWGHPQGRRFLAHKKKKKSNFTARREGRWKKPLLYKGELKKISKALRKDAEMIELGGAGGWENGSVEGANRWDLKTTESVLASEEKGTVCLHCPVENTDRCVFAGMGYVFTQDWQTDSPHAHRCYSRKLCKSDVTEKNLAHKPFQHLSSAHYMLLCSYFFPIFSIFLSLYLHISALFVWLSLWV